MHMRRSLQAELLIAALSQKGFKLDEVELAKASSAVVPNRKFTDARKLAAAKKKAAKRGR